MILETEYNKISKTYQKKYKDIIIAHMFLILD